MSELFMLLFGLVELIVLFAIARFVFRRVPVLGALFGLILMIITIGLVRSTGVTPGSLSD